MASADAFDPKTLDDKIEGRLKDTDQHVAGLQAAIIKAGATYNLEPKEAEGKLIEDATGGILSQIKEYMIKSYYKLTGYENLSAGTEDGKEAIEHIDSMLFGRYGFANKSINQVLKTSKYLATGIGNLIGIVNAQFKQIREQIVTANQINKLSTEAKLAYQKHIKGKIKASEDADKTAKDARGIAEKYKMRVNILDQLLGAGQAMPDIEAD